MGSRAIQDGIHELLQPPRPKDLQDLFATIEPQCGQESRQPEEVITVEVGDENRLQRTAPKPGVHDLELSSFAAVEEEGLILSLQNGT